MTGTTKTDKGARRSPTRRSPVRARAEGAGTPLAAPSPKAPPKLDKEDKGFLDTMLHSDGIETLAGMTGLPHVQVLGVIAFVVAALVFGFGTNLACNVVGFVYPMYKSFQAIELTGLGCNEVEGGATEENLQRCVSLLMYWVCYTFFTIGERFSDVLLSWIPFYYPLKLALLIWCLKYDGAEQMYRSTFGKLLKQYEPQINQATEQFSQHATTFVSDVKTGGQKMAREHSASILSAGMGAVNKLTAPAAPTKSD